MATWMARKASSWSASVTMSNAIQTLPTVTEADIGSSAGLIVGHVLSFSSINVGLKVCSIVGRSEGENDRFCISVGRNGATKKGASVVGAPIEGANVGDNVTLVG